MLSAIVKEHQAKVQERRNSIEEKRKTAVDASVQLASALVDRLNLDVAQAYCNQRKLDAEAKQLHTNVQVLAKQTAQWTALMNNFNSTLKQLGDVENWSRTIEADMRQINSALEYSYKVGPSQSGKKS